MPEFDDLGIPIKKKGESIKASQKKIVATSEEFDDLGIPIKKKEVTASESSGTPSTSVSTQTVEPPKKPLLGFGGELESYKSQVGEIQHVQRTTKNPVVGLSTKKTTENQTFLNKKKEEEKPQNIVNTIKDDVSKMAIYGVYNTTDLLRENAKRGVYNDYLDAQQKEELSLIQNTQAIDKKLKLSPDNHELQVQKRKADTEYDVYILRKNNAIDEKIAELEKNIALPNYADWMKQDWQKEIQTLQSQKEGFFKDKVDAAFISNKPQMDEMQIEGKTPKEKLINYYLVLQKKAKKYQEQLYPNGLLDVTRMGLPFGMTDYEVSKKAELDEVESTLKQLTPIVLINRSPLKSDEGFFSSAIKKATNTILPNTEQTVLTETQKANLLNVAITQTGIKPSEVSDIISGNITAKIDANKPYSANWWGELTGSSAGMMPSFAASGKLVSSLKAVQSMNKALGAKKFGKFLATAIEEGLAYKGAGYISQDDSNIPEQSSFMSGFLGSSLGQGAAGVLGGKLAVSAFNKLFGKNATAAKELVVNASNRVANGLGEYAQEYGQTVGSLVTEYQKTGDWNELKTQFNDQFGSMSKNLEFFVSTFTMGLVMGGSTELGRAMSAKAKDQYDAMSDEDKAKADAYTESVNDDIKEATVETVKEEVKNGAEPPVSNTVIPEQKQAVAEAKKIILNENSTPAELLNATKTIQEVEKQAKETEVADALSELLTKSESLKELLPEVKVEVPEVTPKSVIQTVKDGKEISQTPITENGKKSESQSNQEGLLGTEEKTGVTDVTPSETKKDDGGNSVGGEVEVPKKQNFTQFAKENGYPDDYDTSFQAQLLGGRGLEGKRQSNRSIKEQDDAFQEMQNKKAEGKKAYEQAILDGKVIDPDGKLTRVGILKRDYDFDKKELESKIANAESGIKNINGLGKMAHLDNGKLKKGYQRAVDDYNETITKNKEALDKLKTEYEQSLKEQPKAEQEQTQLTNNKNESTNQTTTGKAKPSVSKPIKSVKETPSTEVAKEETVKPVKLSTFKTGDTVTGKKGTFIIVNAKTMGMKNVKTKKVEKFNPNSTSFTQVAVNQDKAIATGRGRVKAADRKTKDPYLKNAQNSEVFSAEEAVLKYFASGGRVSNDAMGVNENRSGLGLKAEEVRARMAYRGSNDNKQENTIDAVTHSIWENIPEELNIDIQDVRDEVEMAITNYTNPKQMAEELDRRQGGNIRRAEDIKAGIITDMQSYSESEGETVTNEENNAIADAIDNMTDEQFEEAVKGNIEEDWLDGIEDEIVNETPWDSDKDANDKAKQARKAKKQLKDVANQAAYGPTGVVEPTPIKSELEKTAANMSKAEFVAKNKDNFENKQDAEKYWEQARENKFTQEVITVKKEIDDAIRDSRSDLAFNPIGNFIVYSKLAKLMGLYAKKGVTKFSDFIKSTGYKSTQVLKDLWDKITNKGINGRKTPKAKLDTLNSSLFYHEAIKQSLVADAQQILDNMKNQIDVFNLLLTYANPNIVHDIELARNVFQEKYVELSADLNTVNAKLAEEQKQGQKVFELNDKLSVKDRLLRSFTDDFIAQKRLQENIKELKGSIPDNKNPYMQRDISIGRIIDKVDKLNQKLFGKNYGDIETKAKGEQSMIARMKKDGITQPQLDLYLYAKHAAERNERVRAIQEIRGETPGDSGSGMTDQEAQQFLDEFDKAGKTPMLEKYAKEFRDTVILPSIDILEDSGNISAEQSDMLRNGTDKETGVKFEHYVPLWVNNGMFADVENQTAPTSGQPIKKLKGTDKYDYAKRNSPFAQSLLSYHAAVKAAEENKTKQSLYRLVQDNPNGNVWEIVNPNLMTPKRVETNSVKMKVDGKEVWVHLKNKDLQKAWLESKGNPSEFVKIVTAAFRTFNNAIRAIAITFNPEFGIKNYIRDIQDAVFQSTGLEIKSGGRKIVKNLPKINWALAKAAAGKLRPDSKYGKLLDEYLQAGGRVSWINANGIEDEIKNIRKYIGTPNYASKSIGIAAKTLSAFNDIMETSTRLSVFKTMRDNGVSAQKAAFISKNLSVNFNKKGTATHITNTLWMFSNAGLQATVNGFTNVATSKKARMYAAGTVVAGLGYSYLLQSIIKMVSGDDEEEKYYTDLISQNELEGKFIIPIGDKKFFTIDKGYGMFRYSFNMGQEIGFALQDKNIQKHALNMALQARAQIDPISGNSSNILSSWTPTIAKPIIDIATNKTYNNTPIYPTTPFWSIPEADHEMYFKSVNPYFKDFTEMAFSKTNGIVDISPETIEYMTDGYTGGIIKVLKNSATGVANIYNNAPTSINKIPFIRNFITDMSDQEWRFSKVYYDTYNKAGKEILTQKELADFKQWGRKVKDKNKFDEAYNKIKKAQAELRKEINN